MSKAILVMDMPECCYICPLTQCEADNMSTEHRSEDCPLREMPEKMKICGNYPQPDGILPAYKAGWNACIDAIEGSGANG